MRRRRLPLASTAALVLLTALPVAAQYSSESSRASIGASIVPGLSVQKTQDLIIGAFRPGQSIGTVEIEAGGSGGSGAASRTATGSVALAASPFSPAQFNVSGTAGGPVHFAVVLPSSITIQRVGGGETMTVDAFRSNLSSECAPGAPAGNCPAAPYTLVVGATLHVEANQKAGQYVGSFVVTVNQL